MFKLVRMRRMHLGILSLSLSLIMLDTVRSLTANVRQGVPRLCHRYWVLCTAKRCIEIVTHPVCWWSHRPNCQSLFHGVLNVIPCRNLIAYAQDRGSLSSDKVWWTAIDSIWFLCSRDCSSLWRILGSWKQAKLLRSLKFKPERPIVGNYKTLQSMASHMRLISRAQPVVCSIVSPELFKFILWTS